MVPVDHVARLVVAATLTFLGSGVNVVQVTSNERLRFDAYLGTMETYGYCVPEVDYHTWRSRLEDYVNDENKEVHAL